MAYIRGVFIPSVQATINVAWETLKAKWPENSPCMELIRGPGPGARPAQQGTNFRTFSEGGDNTEMTTMHAEEGYADPNSSAVAEDSFSYQRNG